MMNQHELLRFPRPWRVFVLKTAVFDHNLSVAGKSLKQNEIAVG